MTLKCWTMVKTSSCSKQSPGMRAGISDSAHRSIAVGHKLKARSPTATLASPAKQSKILVDENMAGVCRLCRTLNAKVWDGGVEGLPGCSEDMWIVTLTVEDQQLWRIYLKHGKI